MLPFLKWPGGKRWFVVNQSAHLPTSFNRYIEPFLGAGSVFFHLRPKRSILSDINDELIATYQAIKKDWKKVFATLHRHQRDHCKRHYYKMRARVPDDPLLRAARTIYLNRTCFNGIYRVNLVGQFNVPVGEKTAVVMETDDFAAVSQLLQQADLRISDFEPVIDEAKRGDLVFADPPYTVRHNNNGFVKYNEKLFAWTDQVRLADALARAKQRGVNIVATNASHSPLIEIYRDRGFIVRRVERYSSISAEPESRKHCKEIVILST